jgi:tetratricopeptide (TPR) repeat protein
MNGRPHAAAPGVLQRMLPGGLRHHQAGRLAEAERVYRRILAKDARHADSLYLYGMIEYQRGRYRTAAQAIGQAIAIDENQAHYHADLGTVLQAQGRLEESAACYRRALALQPELAEVHANLGNVLLAQGNSDEAMACYERALVLQPKRAEFLYNLGNLHRVQGRLAEAVACLERAVALRPDYVNAHNNLGVALAKQGRTADAIAHYERALQSKPDHAEAHNNLALALMRLGNTAEAMAHCEQALAVNPNHASALNNLGNICKEQGRFEEALTHYGRAIASQPDFEKAHFNRSEIRSFVRGDAELGALEQLAARHGVPADQALHIHFALAKALDDTGDYPRAFEHLRRGNVLKRAQIDYDEAAVLGMFERIAAVFDRALFDRLRGSGDPSAAPLFVLGMPRSGSTLVEQILASHPRIHGAGELEYLEKAAGALSYGDPPVSWPECVASMDGAALRRLGEEYVAHLPAASEGKTRIVDKLPGNFLNIGLIHLILPNARIIHTVRDPVDTCLSCFFRLFDASLYFTYDLGELGRYYRGYRKLMAHWRSVLPPGAILDVSYESVVGDLNGQARRLIDYCGLCWDERCVDFYRTRRAIRTASAVQVRQPLFRSSLQRWRHYEANLAPLLRELDGLL